MHMQSFIAKPRLDQKLQRGSQICPLNKTLLQNPSRNKVNGFSAGRVVLFTKNGSLSSNL